MALTGYALGSSVATVKGTRDTEGESQMTTSTKTERRDDVWEAENRESETAALAMMNAHKASGGKFAWVSWKHEGSAGPTYVAAEGFRYDTRGLEPNASGAVVVTEAFGNVCDACGWDELMHSRHEQQEGLFYLGWMRRADARRLAKWAGVRLEEQ